METNQNELSNAFPQSGHAVSRDGNACGSVQRYELKRVQTMTAANPRTTKIAMMTAACRTATVPMPSINAVPSPRPTQQMIHKDIFCALLITTS